jgi:hypothetical protein
VAGQLLLLLLACVRVQLLVLCRPMWQHCHLFVCVSKTSRAAAAAHAAAPCIGGAMAGAAHMLLLLLLLLLLLQ